MALIKPILSHKLFPYGLALLLTLSVLGLHMLPSMDSMLNENNTRISHVFLKSQIDYHNELPPFARRPLTTFLMKGTSSIFNIKAGYSFIFINFSLLFLSAILLYHLSLLILSERKLALFNVLVYYLSFSIVFAFFPPVFSYDEPLQYCLLFAALITWIRKRNLIFILLFTLAIISRETSLFLIPALWIFQPGKNEQIKPLWKQYLKTGLILLVPILVYAIYLSVFLHYNQLMEETSSEMASRYSCFLENFEDLKNSVESFTSLYLGLIVFLLFTVIRTLKLGINQVDRKFLYAFWLTAIINTPIVILTAFARETRLFALPMIFLWPVFSSIFRVSSFKWPKQWPINNLGSIILSLLTLINIWYSFLYYQKFGLSTNTFYKEYLFIINLLLHLYFTVQFFPKTERTK